MKKYYLIEQGQYSDYGVSIVDITDCDLSKEEILILLKIDQWDKPEISGTIEGVIDFFDNSSIDITDLKEEAECNINRLFCCYSNREYKTVLDKEYSKEELFKIVIANDNSGEDYWRGIIDEKYKDYLEGYKIYKKLCKTNPTK